jgi:aminoglycoside phosphotransferase family enzyme
MYSPIHTANNREIFYERINQSKVRDIHGDLYLKNIFIVRHKFYLYDRIEFNDSLRFADVAEDIAHISMDLDHYKKFSLRKHFLSQYLKKSNDNTLDKLIYFWMRYKACVRAKVFF